MANILSDLTDGIRRLQKLNKDMSELELKEEILNLRQLLMDAKEAVLNKEEEVRALTEKMKDLTSGETCPICRNGTLQVTASRPHEHFAFAGVQTRVMKCTSCSHTEDRMHDPSGITKR